MKHPETPAEVRGGRGLKIGECEAVCSAWNPEKGFGFLQSEEHKDLFVHRSSLREIEDLKVAADWKMGEGNVNRDR